MIALLGLAATVIASARSFQADGEAREARITRVESRVERLENDRIAQDERLKAIEHAVTEENLRVDRLEHRRD